MECRIFEAMRVLGCSLLTKDSMQILFTHRFVEEDMHNMILWDYLIFLVVKKRKWKAMFVKYCQSVLKCLPEMHAHNVIMRGKILQLVGIHT